MSLDIRELYKSDLDPNYVSTWWSTKKVEKLNWNFDRILESGGGPLGPQGWLGKSGKLGADGAQGTNGRQGPVGNIGNQGFTGETDWIENYAAGNNTSILIKQIKDDPYDVKVGYSNTAAEYSSVAIHSGTTAGVGGRGSINRWNTPNSTQWNAVFTSSDIDGSVVDISGRKVYFWNLYKKNELNDLILSAEFESGFRNITGGRTKFISNKFVFQTPIFTNNGLGIFTTTTPTNLKEYLNLDSSQFLLDPGVLSSFSNTAIFKATTDSGIPINHKFGPNFYTNPGAGKIAFTSPDTSGNNGIVKWGNAYDVIGGFPVGSIIITQDEFIDAFFHLEESGTVVNKGNVSGFDSPSTTPVIEFKYGAGKLGTKFEGWYLCNGKTWSKGSVSYELPNLCGFDLNVDYDIFSDLFMGSIVANGNINQSTPNKPIQGSAVIKFRAREANSQGSYLFDNGTNSQTEVLQSYIDSGEPKVNIYEGPGVNTFDYEDGRNGLIYLCYLGQDGFKWNTSETPVSITLNTVSLSYNAATITAACSASATSYKANFATAWNDGSYWTTNGNKLYNSAGTDYAPSGYYHSNGIVRYWNYSTTTQAFTSRDACPSYTSIQLAYNSSVISSGLNGTFSTRTKSTYYINSTALSSATLLYTNSTGTTYATAGWYRDAGSRRYWSGTSFVGALFVEDYVNYLSALMFDTTAAGSCLGYSTYGYYENSAATSKTFSGSSGISYLYTSGTSTTGTGPLDYASSSYYYSDGTVRRQCTNSFTGALGTAASCSVSPSPPSGGGSSGGGSGGGCVLFGTKIKMADGTTKMVQDVLIGDTLYSKSIDTMPINEELDSLYKWNSNKIEVTDDTVTVVGNRSHNVDTVYSINDGKLFTSWDHNHVCKHNNIWKISKTINLEAGDSLVDENGKEVIINNIIAMTGQFIVYKLDVEENDLYIANGILTHNLKTEDYGSGGNTSLQNQ